MSKLAVLAVAAGAFALTLVSLAPSSAEAGWRRGYWGWGGGWGGPGVGVYVGPRYNWYGPRRYWRPRYPAGYPYAYYPYWRYRYGW
jgi:hypothetical protein